MKEENERNEGRDDGRKKMDEMKEEIKEENGRNEGRSNGRK